MSEVSAREGPRKHDLPNDWKIKKLGELCAQIQDGTHFTPSYVTNGVPFYSVENITKRDFNDCKYVTLQAHDIMARRCRPQRGDILMTRITAGIIGDTHLIDWDHEASIYVSLCLLRPKGNVSANYLYAFSKSQLFIDEVEKRALLHATPKKINLGEIGEMQICVPDDPNEQEAIAAALSDADGVVAGLERVIAKKRLIKQGAMQDLLTAHRRLPGFSEEWEVKRLGELVTVIMGQSPSSSAYNSQGEGLPLIQGNADIKDRKAIIRTFTRQITKLGKAGDYLLSVRAPVGEISTTNMDVCLGRGVCALRTDERLIYHIMVAKEPEWAKLSTGSTFDSVNGSVIRAFEVLFPKDKVERLAVAQLLDDMDAEIQTLEARLTKARAVKEGMMQNLLTGRVRLV